MQNGAVTERQSPIPETTQNGTYFQGTVDDLMAKQERISRIREMVLKNSPISPLLKQSEIGEQTFALYLAPIIEEFRKQYGQLVIVIFGSALQDAETRNETKSLKAERLRTEFGDAVDYNGYDSHYRSKNGSGDIDVAIVTGLNGKRISRSTAQEAAYSFQIALLSFIEKVERDLQKAETEYAGPKKVDIKVVSALEEDAASGKTEVGSCKRPDGIFSPSPKEKPYHHELVLGDSRDVEEYLKLSHWLHGPKQPGDETRQIALAA